MYWRKWDFFFCFIVIPDLTFKWRSQRIMTYHYLTEMGFKILKRQYDLYLNSKVAPGTRNATGLWLSLEPESKICAPHLQSWWSLNCREKDPFYGYPLWVREKAKQNKKQQMRSLNTFLQQVQNQSFLTIKLPFTVGFFCFFFVCFLVFLFLFVFCTPCRDSEVIRGNAQGK